MTTEPPAPDGQAVAAEPGAVATEPAAPEPTAPHRSRWLKNGVEWVVVLAIALGVALFVRSYVVQTYFIPSGSMEPTLQIGDHILVFKAAYKFTSPATGDIIVFTAPPAEHVRCQDPEVQDLVKRIIATPGETIWSGQATSPTPSSTGNTIWIENPGSTHPYRLQQPWQHTSTLGQAITRQLVAPDRYFVMGDNRPNSCDSRDWGTVPRANIIGKAIFIFWPPSRMSTL